MHFNINLSEQAKEDILALKKENPKFAAKLWEVLLDIMKDSPYQGLGRPEELKHDFSGWWSRRITPKHRLVYRITEADVLEIAACYGHYGDK